MKTYKQYREDALWTGGVLTVSWLLLAGMASPTMNWPLIVGGQVWGVIGLHYNVRRALERQNEEA